MRKAAFLDRDGVLIEHVHHLINPSDVRLIEGGAKAVARLQASGYACVVITNQSVIGRGMLTVEGLDAIHQEMYRQLGEDGVTLDGLYFCPVKPTQKDPAVIEHPDRKPGPGMLERAARELELDIARSWMIGDSLSDILAGRNAGCRGAILVKTGYGTTVDPEHEAIAAVALDLPDAVSIIEGLDKNAEIPAT